MFVFMIKSTISLKAALTLILLRFFQFGHAVRLNQRGLCRRLNKQ